MTTQSARRRRAAALATAVGVAMAPLATSAAGYSVLDGFLSPGLLASYTFGARGGFGLGAEVAYSHLPTRDPSLMFGAFTQAEHLFWGGKDGGFRGAVGLQGLKLLGLELGGALQRRDDLGGWRSGAHGGAYLALPTTYPMPLGSGPSFTPAFTLALRGTLTLFEKGERPDLALVFTFKNVIPVGAAPYFGPVAGRPLRADDGYVLPPIWREPGVPAIHASLLRGLSARHRDRLSVKWLNDARAEAASVPAFVRLAEDLVAVSAPTTLIAAALKSAAEEVRHAATALDLASAYAETRFATDLTPEVADGHRAASRELELLRLARESWRDGCLGEAAAAASAELASRVAMIPDLRRSLAEVARDESRHAALSWRIVAWCLDSGGDSVREMLRQELALSRDVREPLGVDAEDDGLEEHALLGSDSSRVMSLAARSGACRRLEQLLSGGPRIVLS